MRRQIYWNRLVVFDRLNAAEYNIIIIGLYTHIITWHLYLNTELIKRLVVGLDCQIFDWNRLHLKQAMGYMATHTTKIISQIVVISWGWDQNDDRVSKNNKSCHFCSMRLKSVLVKYEKYGTLLIDDPICMCKCMHAILCSSLLCTHPGTFLGIGEN